MTMETRRTRAICADNDEAARVVGASVVGCVDGAGVGLDVVGGVVGAVVVSASNSHANTIFSIALSRFCTSTSFCLPRV
jgi:hypothetical protein